MARKYSPTASKDVEREMHKFKSGKLKSGSGKTVKSRKQAIAIGLSEARREGKKVPPRPGGRSSARSARSSSTGRASGNTSKSRTASKRSARSTGSTSKRASRSS